MILSGEGDILSASLGIAAAKTKGKIDPYWPAGTITLGQAIAPRARHH
jgi:hypothetical protein